MENKNKMSSFYVQTTYREGTVTCGNYTFSKVDATIFIINDKLLIPANWHRKYLHTSSPTRICSELFSSNILS